MNGKWRPLAFWLGSLAFVSSFFLVAIVGEGVHPGSPRGYVCAMIALVLSIGEFQELLRGLHSERHSFVQSLSLLLSGWITPIFVLTAIPIYLRPDDRYIVILKTALLVMIPSCWVIFYYEKFSPREGHFLWVAGMLMVLLSHQSRPKTPLLDQFLKSTSAKAEENVPNPKLFP